MKRFFPKYLTKTKASLKLLYFFYLGWSDDVSGLKTLGGYDHHKLQKYSSEINKYLINF